MSLKGSASKSTRLATFPGSTVPMDCSNPRNLAGLMVAVCNAYFIINKYGDCGREPMDFSLSNQVKFLWCSTSNPHYYRQGEAMNSKKITLAGSERQTIGTRVGDQPDSEM